MYGALMAVVRGRGGAPEQFCKMWSFLDAQGVRQRGSGVEPAEGSPLVAQGLQRCEQCWRRGCDNVRGGPAFVQLQFAFGCHSCGLADCWDGSPGCTFVGRERVRRADASQTRPDETRRDEMEGGGQGVCP